VPITLDDVYHIASLARLGLTPERASTVVVELNTILEHMDALSKVDTSGVAEAVATDVSAVGTRPDQGPPIPLTRSLDGFAPKVRDGLLLVPRLSSHEAAAES
jgi:aspartyl-tRNA(Asn)/glutamyl-tRNA(Gln) amidotransferase subunit C